MKACNMFLIPLNTNPFAESIITECAYVSFPGTGFLKRPEGFVPVTNLFNV